MVFFVSIFLSFGVLCHNSVHVCVQMYILANIVSMIVCTMEQTRFPEI